MEAAPTTQRLDRGTVMALGALSLAIFVIANDFTALSVALPNIEHDLDTDVTTVQWVINAYALVFGVLIVPAGRIADLFGRRRTFFVGAAIFALFSAVAGAAPDTALLLAGRALMAVGGALMWPAVLGMTFSALPADRAGLAGGLILGVCGIGNAFGPLLGGVLTDAASWRWVLFLNLPIAALACAVTLKQVPADSGDREGEHVDVPGLLTLSVALFALLIALDQATDWGWTDTRVLILLAIFVAGLAAFAGVERRAGPSALVPRDVIGNRAFTAAAIAVGLLAATFFAMLLYVPQSMQRLLGFTPLQAGLGLLPVMITFAITSFVGGRLYDRFGGRRLVCIGAACVPVAAFLLSLANGSHYVSLVPGLVVFGFGIGLFLSAVTSAAVTALDESRTSLAGGILYMFQVAGGSVGLGLTTTVFTSVSRDHAAEGARAAFLEGVHTGFRVDAALALAGLAIVLAFVARGPRAAAPRAAVETAP